MGFYLGDIPDMKYIPPPPPPPPLPSKSKPLIDKKMTDKNIPIIKIHEHLKKYNEEIYFENLKIVKDYIKYKKTEDYKSNLLLEKLGFEYFSSDIITDKKIYSTAKAIVRTFDYYRKNYPNLHFIYSIPPIDGYKHKMLSSYSERISYDDLVTINNNSKLISSNDKRINLTLNFRKGREVYKTVNNALDVPLNIEGKLKDLNININTLGDVTVLNNRAFNKEECKYLEVKYPCVMEFKLEKYSDSCLSKNSLFSDFMDSESEDNGGCETIFLSPVKNGYLITNIVGDNGNLSFSNFQSILNNQEENTDNFEEMMFGNDRYYHKDTFYNSSSGIGMKKIDKFSDGYETEDAGDCFMT
jgi:hypothetical protein